jgi:hypothetical protein
MKGKGEIAEPTGVSIDDGGRVGVCLPCRECNGLVEGQAEELLVKYAWYFANSPRQSPPVGVLWSNNFQKARSDEEDDDSGTELSNGVNPSTEIPALQLAYSGADLAAVVTFHAGLPIPEEEQAKAIKAKILICHGAADSFVPEDTIKKVRAAFEDAKVDYEMNYYGGAQHSFTVSTADKVGLKGMAYNAEADHRSW